MAKLIEIIRRLVLVVVWGFCGFNILKYLEWASKDDRWTRGNLEQAAIAFLIGIAAHLLINWVLLKSSPPTDLDKS
jgi:hypothetical protein